MLFMVIIIIYINSSLLLIPDLLPLAYAPPACDPTASSSAVVSAASFASENVGVGFFTQLV